MGEACFKGIRKSVTRRQNTVVQYIATRSILDLCERSTQRPGVRASWRWWEQAGIYLYEAKKRAAEAAKVSPLAEAMGEACFKGIRKSVTRR